MEKFIPPEFALNAFHCPHCSVFSRQIWSDSFWAGVSGGSSMHLTNFRTAKCDHCDNFSIWFNKSMVFPIVGNVEIPNPDLPKSILDDYNEAKNIINLSPRGSAAMLRLALQKLLINIGEKGKNISDDISSLIKKGLPVQIQQALHAVRVVGNNAVHPGTIDLNDTPQIATALFGLVNVIADYFITQPKKIAEIYGTLPDKDKTAIAKRDGLAAAPPSE